MPANNNHDRMWLLSYLIFNACLYAGQLVLYTLLFLPNSDQVMHHCPQKNTRVTTGGSLPPYSDGSQAQLDPTVSLHTTHTHPKTQNTKNRSSCPRPSS